MEKEKLAESIRTFEEDKERYKLYIEQLGVEAQTIEEDVKHKVKEKNILQMKIKELSEEIQAKSTECGKIDDQLIIHKTSRDFIQEIGKVLFLHHIADFAKLNKSVDTPENKRLSLLEINRIDMQSSRGSPRDLDTPSNRNGESRLGQNIFITTASQNIQSK